MFAIPRFVFFLPQSQKMSGGSEMAISDVLTVESVLRGAAEAPKGAGARGAEEGRGASRAALHEQLAHLQAAIGSDDLVEAMARVMRKAQLWATRKEQLAGNPALAQAIEEVEHLDMVSPSSLLFLAWPQPTSSEQPLCSRSRAWPCTRLRAGSGTSSVSTTPHGRPGSLPSMASEKESLPVPPSSQASPGVRRYPGKEDNKDGR